MDLIFFVAGNSQSDHQKTTQVRIPNLVSKTDFSKLAYIFWDNSSLYYRKYIQDPL